MGTWLQKLIDFFKGNKAEKEINTALQYVDKALPFIQLAAEVASALSPANIPAQVLVVLTSKFPILFNGSVLTLNELESYMLAVAAAMLQMEFPFLSTTTAVLTTQLAYTKAKAEGQAPKLISPAKGAIVLNVKPPKKSFLEI
jgi:hypothetical protein